MQSYYSDVMQFRGTHYDFGHYQGEQLKYSPILPNREKQWGKRSKRHFITDTDTSINIIKDIAPALIDEIHGLADALEVSLADAFKMFGGYYLETPKSGCSIFTESEITTVTQEAMKAGIFSSSQLTAAMLLWARRCKLQGVMTV
ncbi:hypothetical protein SAMN05216187_11072 [Jeotgalicoccus aerolatus]|uniref:Uncharacterized protein n=1 Tax=Jeotgalicoccus aerolatus TaxID=709510 RepID=A0A1G9CXC2_9STAP|nr:hypothetical protein SAMN05216187_11072 [Jeotgalicoccus aerolatus]